MNFDPYKILGVDRDASSEDIKREYRQLCRVHHPDVGGDAEIMAKINRAYAILSDPESRAKFDAGGNPEDSAEREALSLAVSLFERGMDSYINGRSRDPILSAINGGKESLNALLTQLAEQRAGERRLKAIPERITRKSDGENFLRSHIESKLEQLRSEMARNVHEEDVHLAAIKLLEDYAFKPDEPSSFSAYQSLLLSQIQAQQIPNPYRA